MPYSCPALRDAFHKIRGLAWRHSLELQDLVHHNSGVGPDEAIPKEVFEEMILLQELRSDILRTPWIIYTLDVDALELLSARQKLHVFLEESTTRVARWYSWTYVSMMILGLVPVMIESLPNASHTYLPMRILEYFVMLIFMTDFLARVFVAPSLKRFMRHASTWVELIVITVFVGDLFIPKSYRQMHGFALANDLGPVVRLVLAVRKIQIVKLLCKSLREALEPLLVVLYFFTIIVWFTGTFLYFFSLPLRRDMIPSLADEVYVSIYTLYGIGFGLQYYIPAGSKIVLALLMMFGHSLMSLPLRLMGSHLTQVLRHRGVVWLIEKSQKRFELYGFPEENYRLIFRSMDRKRNGYVTYEEFVDFCRLIGGFSRNMSSESAKSRLIETFKEFDPKCTGVITLAGFTSGVIRSGIRKRREILQALQKEYQYEQSFLKPPPELEELDTQIKKMITRIDMPRIAIARKQSSLPLRSPLLQPRKSFF